MEQAYTGHSHDDAVLIASVDDIIVADAASGLGHILHAASVSALDVVAEWEEGITTQTNILVLGNPLFLLLTGEHLRLTGEEVLPCSVAKHVVVLIL